MKATTELQQRIAAAIAPYDTKIARQTYRELRIPRAESVKDLNKRYRWDLLWIAYDHDATLRYAISEANLLDAHIDTALRAIVPVL